MPSNLHEDDVTCDVVLDMEMFHKLDFHDLNFTLENKPSLKWIRFWLMHFLCFMFA